MQKHVVLDKKIGQTPLQCMDLYKETHPELMGVKTTYEGRLDPMASGKLLMLIGEECKNQLHYRSLDKEYEFEVLFGMQSDTGDILGRLTENSKRDLALSCKEINYMMPSLTGEIDLPYPHFSSKTVRGKPLHTWALENRIDEIKIPTKQSTIYNIRCTNIYNQTRTQVHAYATTKIETIPPVTELRKAIGNDFRRTDVRKDWQQFLNTGSAEDIFYIAKFTCIASSGTYMRTLAEIIAKKFATYGIAYSIHRTKIGKYKKLPVLGGAWITLYR